MYSTTRPKAAFRPKDPALLQAEIDRDKGPVFVAEAEGRASVESYTVMHERAGPAYAILYGRLDDGRRFIANAPDDKGLLADMVAEDFMGAKGRVRSSGGRNIFVPG
jgi:acetyl-CoA C-acetyltransferase